MQKKLTKQEVKERLARRAARKAAFPPSGPRYISRKTARNIAHFNMEKEGVKRVNKLNPKTHKSMFSISWRKWVFSAIPRPIRRRRF